MGSKTWHFKNFATPLRYISVDRLGPTEVLSPGIWLEMFRLLMPIGWVCAAAVLKGACEQISITLRVATILVSWWQFSRHRIGLFRSMVDIRQNAFGFGQK